MPDSPAHAPVRCPAIDCSAVFAVRVERLGRNLYCPVCRNRMTTRPAEVDARLEIAERRAPRGDGTAIERLPLVVLIDNVRSLWNVGSIFRTADACGVEEMALTGITGHPPRPEIAKTALGAEDAVRWCYRRDPFAALAEFAARGFVPVAVETARGAAGPDTIEWPERTCLIVGNEVSGISPRVLDACERFVRIPMLGEKDSLNVAVAFGIAAFQAARALSGATALVPGSSDR